MRSYKTPQEVLVEIGEKPSRAFTLAVRGAREDLRVYRQTFPQWVADHSERGLANWINDRLWAHLVLLADSISDVRVIENGPLRELTVGYNFRFRLKRHDGEGNIASYPTQGFLDFAIQPLQGLPGMEETRLVAGYDWLKESREIGSAVFSLRDGKDNVIWKEAFPKVQDETVGNVTDPKRDAPVDPTIGLPQELGKKPEEGAKDA